MKSQRLPLVLARAFLYWLHTGSAFPEVAVEFRRLARRQQLMARIGEVLHTCICVLRDFVKGPLSHIRLRVRQGFGLRGGALFSVVGVNWRRRRR